MKIYTRSGDMGDTGLIGGARLRKSELIISCLGELDELNSWLGKLRCLSEFQAESDLLGQLQNALFELGAVVAEPDQGKNEGSFTDLIASLETSIDDLTDSLPELRAFILPGGTMAAADAHIARSVARRAERTLALAYDRDAVQAEALPLLNRLSDWLFCLARLANHRSGVADTEWRKG